MAVMEGIKARARTLGAKIVLPEGDDERIVQAAAQIVAEGLAKVTLLMSEKTASFGVDLSGVECVWIQESEDLDNYAQALYELRKNKGLTLEHALELVKQPLYFGTMMLKMGAVDGMVAGANHATGDVLRPALQIVKTLPNIRTVSSCFIMEVDKPEYGDNGVMVFADCAVVPDPDSEELAAIALSAASSAKVLLGMQPRVAMLSFSTKGSAQHDRVDRVIEATRIAHQLAPDLCIDGELQADAALVPSIGNLKCPGSEVAGKANVLVFPDLSSGNIGYKLVQRLAGAQAIGPVCQGLAKPVNDLSRGCSVEDVVGVAAITALQAKG